MSKTSTTFNKSQNGDRNNCKNGKIKNEFPENNQKNKNAIRKKWPKERVLDEMSTFIAEFSYLTDTQESNGDKDDPKNFSVYTAHGENNQSIFRPNRENYDYYYVDEGDLPRKSVEWVDQKSFKVNKERKKGNKLKKKHDSSEETSERDRLRNHKADNPRDHSQHPLKTKKNGIRKHYRSHSLKKRKRDNREYTIHRDRGSLDGKTSLCSCERCSRPRQLVTIESSRSNSHVCSRRSRSRRTSRGGSKVHNRRNSIKPKGRSNSPNCCETREKHITPIGHKPRASFRSGWWEETKEPPCCPDNRERRRSPKHMPIKYERRKSKYDEEPPCSRDRSVRKRSPKYMPIKYKGRESKCDELTERKKGNCIRYERKKSKEAPCTCCETMVDPYDQKIIESKVAITDSPTIVTLFPKKHRINYKKLSPTGELEFLQNQELPCKCFQCMKKYESLVKMCPSPQNLSYKPKEICQQPIKTDRFVEESPVTVYYEPVGEEFVGNSIPKKGCFPVCSKTLIYLPLHPKQHSDRKKKAVQFSQFNETWESDWSYEAQDVNYKPCPFPCDKGGFVSEWNIDSGDEQNGRRSFKSVYFKLNCFNQQIDSAITQYFKSILNNNTCQK